jgi:predicted AAA+ superfamily ATPase
MQAISKEDVLRRIRAENPWWEGDHSISAERQKMKPRAYFDLFLPMIEDRAVHRAIILMGPRRVGKTVMIHHAIQTLIAKGIKPINVGYFSVDQPLYNGLSLEALLD